MSTVSEIEEAVESLTAIELETILRKVVGKLNELPTEHARLSLHDGQAVLVAPPGTPKMTSEYVRELQEKAL